MNIYRYRWGPRWRGMDADHDEKWLPRKGALCLLIARGAMNSALVEFEDGEREIVSRNALGRVAGDVAEVVEFLRA